MIVKFIKRVDLTYSGGNGYLLAENTAVAACRLNEPVKQNGETGGK